MKAASTAKEDGEDAQSRTGRDQHRAHSSEHEHRERERNKGGQRSSPIGCADHGQRAKPYHTQSQDTFR